MILGKKVSENEMAVFYKNALCTDFGDGYAIIIGKQKSNGFTEYLLMKDNVFVHHSTDIENIWLRHDILKKLDNEKL